MSCGSLGVIVVAPLLEYHSYFPRGFDLLSVQEFIPQLAIKRFRVPILPQASSLYMQRRYFRFCQPSSYRLRRDFCSVIRLCVFRLALGAKQFGQRVNHIVATKLMCHNQRKAFPVRLVDDDEYPICLSTVGPIMNESDTTEELYGVEKITGHPDC
jgi:hypothetical protein